MTETQVSHKDWTRFAKSLILTTIGLWSALGTVYVAAVVYRTFVDVPVPPEPRFTPLRGALGVVLAAFCFLNGGALLVIFRHARDKAARLRAIEGRLGL